MVDEMEKAGPVRTSPTPTKPHRIHAPIDRCGLQATGISDLFGVKGRVYIDATLDKLPRDTAAMIQVQLTLLDQLEAHIEEIEDRIVHGLPQGPAARRR